MKYKQVITDTYDMYNAELDMVENRLKVLDIDVEEIEDLSSYNIEDRFENMFSPLLFWEGNNHVIKVQLYRMEDDECTDDPVYEHSFRLPYLFREA